MWPEMVGSVLRLAVVQPSFDSQSTSLRLAACSLRTFDMVVARHERALRLAEGESQGESNGAPGRIRTCGLWLRRPTLYPAELRARERKRIAFHPDNAIDTRSSTKDYRARTTRPSTSDHRLTTIDYRLTTI